MPQSLRFLRRPSIAPLAPPTRRRMEDWPRSNGLTNGHMSTASPASSIREGSGPNVCLSGSSGWPLRDHTGIAAFQSVQIVGTSGDSLVCLDCGYTELVIPATKLEQLKKVWNHLVHGVRKRDLLLKMARIWRGEPGKVNVGNTQISMLCRPGVHAYFSGL